MPGGEDDDGGVIIIKKSIVKKILHALPHGHPLRDEINEELAKERPAIPPGGTPSI